MKKTLLILLMVLLVVSVTFAFVACDEQDPCKNGHSWDAGEITKPATCDAEGTKLVRCKICGATEEQTVGKTQDHVWKEPEVTTEPTCSTPGEGKVTCSVCGTSQTRTVEATGVHEKGDFVDRVEPTCTGGGTLAYYKCKNCDVKLDVNGNEVSDAELAIAKVAHNYDNGVITTEATCEHDGVKTFTCQNDGCTESFTQKLPKVPHKYGRLNEMVPATCEENGSQAFYQCSACSKKFDSDKNEVVDESSLVIKATGHTNRVLDRVEPTCTQSGLTEGLDCSVCGKVLKAQVVIAALGHIRQTVQGYAPTCEKSGLTDGTKCSRCGNWIIMQKNIKANGHSYVHHQEIPVSCADGVAEHYTCSVCFKWFDTDKVERPESYFITVPGDGQHGFLADSWVEEVPATCTQDGTVGYQQCFNCHRYFQRDGRTEIFERNLTIPALGHDWKIDQNSWSWTDYTQVTVTFDCTHSNCPEQHRTVVSQENAISSRITTDAECESDGVRTYTALVTGPDDVVYTNDKTQVIPQLGHNWGVNKTTWTNTHNGVQVEFKCSRCEQTGSAMTTSITKKQTKEPTCTEKGETTYSATVTYKENKYDVSDTVADVNMIPHSWKYTHNNNTETHNKECSVCGEKVADESCQLDYTKGACKLCEFQYPDDNIVLHFYNSANWETVSLWAWNDYHNFTGGKWPGVKVTMDDDGWYTYTLTEKHGVMQDVQFIFNNSDHGSKTNDLKVTANEMWVFADDSTFTDKAKAEEYKGKLEAIPSEYWFVYGMFQGEQNGSETATKIDRVFTEENSYTLQSSYGVGNSFKFKQNVAGWDKQIGFGSGWTISAVDSLKTKDINLLLQGNSYQDFIVKYSCTLRFTFDPANETVAILVLDADASLPNKTATPTERYIIAGIVGGVTKWENNITDADRTFKAQDNGTYTLDVNFKQNDKFKVWKWGTYDALWYAGTKPIISYAPNVTQVKDLFGGSDDVLVNYTCNVTITINTNKTISVYVKWLDTKQLPTQYYMQGTMNNWGNNADWNTERAKYELTPNGDGTYSLEIVVTSGWEFKIVGGSWYGLGDQDKLTISGDLESSISKANDGGDMKITYTGKVKMTFDPVNHTLVVNKVA